MAGLADIVTVLITRETRTVSLPGFGTALFLGPNATGLTQVANMADVTGAGFTSGEAEYKAALAYFSQPNKPKFLLIGKRTAPIAQVVTFTPTALNTQLYTVVINGIIYTVTSSGSATATTIVTQLKTAITDPSVAASGTATLIVTAAVAGTPFSYTPNADVNIAAVLTTPSNGVVEDIEAANQAAITAKFDWYMLGLGSRSQADIQNAAAYIESQFKMFIGCSSDAGIIGSGNTDVASILMVKDYTRTALLYSADQADFPEMAWMGTVLPLNAGSETWKFKSLVGITPDDQLTSTQFANLKAKNCNFYYTVAGVPITSQGMVAGGDFIDNTRFIDWYTVTMQGSVYSRLVSLPKVPYTDEGFSQIEADMRGVNQQAERVGGLAKGSSFVIVPTVASETTQDRGNRNANNFQFGGTLAGAVHDVQIQGFLSI